MAELKIYTKAALEKGTIWVSENGNRIIIKSKEYTDPGQVAQILATNNNGWEGTKYTNVRDSYFKNPTKSSLYVGVIKLLNGWRDLKTNKGIFRVGPWRLEGIIINNLEDFLPKKGEVFSNEYFQTLDSRQKLLFFLENEKNKYSEFILPKINRNLTPSPVTYLEKHHIIPKHMGGVDRSFNLVLLTYDEHTEAHALLYEVFHREKDALVVTLRDAKRVLKGPKPELFRGESFPKNNYSKFAMERGTIWRSINNHRVVIAPNQCSGVGALARFLANESDGWIDTNHQHTLESFQKNEKNSIFYRYVVRLITGWREPKSRGNVYSAGPWYLEGVLFTPAKDFVEFRQKVISDSFPINVPHLPGKENFFCRISQSGKECGFTFTGILDFENVDKSAIEFFCLKHKLFIVRSWSTWNRCFAKNNSRNRPACCNSEQKSIKLSLDKEPTLSLTSNFKTISEGISFSSKEQEQIIEKLANPHQKCVKAGRNSGVPETIKQQMMSLGHVIIGTPPQTQREFFLLRCTKHNNTVETNIDRYRTNQYGMRCCAIAEGNACHGFKIGTKFRKNGL